MASAGCGLVFHVPLQHFARQALLVGLPGERARLDRNRREIGLQLVCLARQRQRVVGPPGRALRGGLLMVQERPPAGGGLAIDQLVPGHVADRAQRLGPQARAGLQIEQGGQHPRRVRPPQVGAPRQAERGLPVALLHRLREQAAQPKELGLGMLEHLLELGSRRGFVVLELGGLRTEQEGGWRMPEQLVGAAVQQLRRRGIARRGGDQTLRQGLVPPIGARAAHAPADPAGRAAEQPQELEQDDHGHGEQQQADEKHRDRGLDLHALPGQRDPARMIRQPRRGERQRDRDHQEQDEPDHRPLCAVDRVIAGLDQMGTAVTLRRS